MLKLGQFNSLKVIKTLLNAAVLDGGDSGRVLLTPQNQEHFEIGQQLEVFVYLDSEGELAATTVTPLAQLGHVAWLKVVEVNQVGAFVDWGLPRDLFVPFGEQQYELHSGDYALVKVYLDNQKRLAGSTKIDRWVKDEPGDLTTGEQVSLVIADKTELGYKAVVNHRAWGLLYANELFQTIHKGQTITGYVKAIRDDNKLDLSLVKPGYAKSKIEAVSEQILIKLDEHGGHLLLNDKSPPEAIYKVFKVSKKVFKQAVGALYKQRRITLDARGISLNKE